MGQVTDIFNITINEPTLKAFPEATGFGAYGIDLTPNLGAWSLYFQTGNLADRPDVYEVTNGNLSGAGSIFDALATQSGPRIIIINTDAKLLLTSTLNIVQDYTTIYRVTAGGAFALTGFKFQVEASYVIIRRLSFYNNGNNDSLAITASAARPQPKYIIVDEYNAGWNQDEASATNASFSITGRHIQDITFSRGLIFDGIDPSSPKGALLNGTNHVTRGTIDRVAFINQNQRNPKVSGRDTDPSDPGQGNGSFPPTLLPFQVAMHDISNIISYNVGQRHFIMNGGAKVNLRAYKQINGPDTIAGRPVLYITTEDWLTPTIEPVATNEQYTGLYYHDVEIEAGMVELSMVYDKSSPTSWGAEGATRFIESSEIIEAMAPVRPSLIVPANMLTEAANWGGGEDSLAAAARMDLNSGTGSLKSGQNFNFALLQIPNGIPKSLAGEPAVNSVNDIQNHLDWLNGLLEPLASAPNAGPSELGSIISEHTHTLDDWTVSGNYGTEQADGVLLSGGNASFTTNLATYENPASPHNITQLEKWKMTLAINSGTLNGSSFGLGLGIKSTHNVGGEQINGLCRIAMQTGADQGKSYFYDSSGFSDQQIVGGNIALVSDTDYIMELERDGQDMHSRLYDATGTTLIVDNSFTYNLVSTNSFWAHNTGKFCIWNFGGGVLIRSINISSTHQKNVDVVCIGDSNLFGLYQGTAGNRYIDRAFSNFPNTTYEVLAGQGDETAEVLARIPEILALNPQRAYINLISNDIANGKASGVYEANYNSIISQLEAAGVTVFLGTPIARNSFDMTAASAFVSGLGKPVADLFDQTKNAGNQALQAQYDSGDAIHLSSQGAIDCDTRLRGDTPGLFSLGGTAPQVNNLIGDIVVN